MRLALNVALSGFLAVQIAPDTDATQPRRVPAPPASSGARRALVTARNPIGLARAAETLTIRADDLRRLVGIDDPRQVQVLDSAGQSVLSQPIDLNDAESSMS